MTFHWIWVSLMILTATSCHQPSVERVRTIGAIEYHIHKIQREHSGLTVYLRMQQKESQESIAYYNIDSEAAYKQRVNYLNFSMLKNAWIENNGNQVYADIYHCEDNSGLTPYITMIYHFPSQEGSIDTHTIFAFNDDVFEGGTQKFAIK